MPADGIALMQQSSFAQLQHRSPGTGSSPAAAAERCAATRPGEVRPYSPFGLMNLQCESGAKAAGVRGESEQEQRGRTGLAA